MKRARRETTDILLYDGAATQESLAPMTLTMRPPARGDARSPAELMTKAQMDVVESAYIGLQDSQALAYEVDTSLWPSFVEGLSDEARWHLLRVVEAIQAGVAGDGEEESPSARKASA